MKDLFTSAGPRVATYLPTMAQVIVRDSYWYKGRLEYHCLVPQKGHKGEWELCDSCYPESAISFDIEATNGAIIILEEIKNIS